jgi:2-polyprenyl-3-methyl-5-hydroxy-6-metoxy-1,4-benzoquinol methylase
MEAGKTMSATQSLFWAGHYARPEVRENPWLDMSNEAVQTQTFGLALEAAGPLLGKSCLDAGCGAGRFSALLATMGARDITAIDQVLEPRYQDPRIRWVRANLEDDLRLSSLPLFHHVFALEVLQYIPFASGLQTLWQRVRPGGRLIAVVPNGACPLVRQAAERFGAGNFTAPTPREVCATLASLADASIRAVRGLTFQQEQQIVPYRVDAWGRDPLADPPPNRWLVVAVKSA